jgi:CBS domain-containing protein
MKIKDIMTTNIATIEPNAYLNEVARKMLDYDCGCVLVAKNDRLLGVITDRDIVVRCIAKDEDPTETMAENIMTAQVLYCYEEDDADDVTRNMAENKVRRMVVLNEQKRMVGMVSLGDLASHSNHQLCGEVLGTICKAPKND